MDKNDYNFISIIIFDILFLSFNVVCIIIFKKKIIKKISKNKKNYFETLYFLFLKKKLLSIFIFFLPELIFRFHFSLLH